jgi:hypothetical protein
MSQRDGQTAGWLSVLTSPWVLLPFTAGISVGVIAWLFDREEYVLLPILVGILVTFGAAFTVRTLNSGPGVDADVARLRRQLLDDLEAVTRTGGSCPESELTGTPAQAEP